MQPCRGAGALVALHSDGHVMELMDEFIRCGVDIINPQDLVNGIDNLAREVKGRMCIRLDIDRQSIVPFGTRAEIRELIEEEVKRLGSPGGGLGLTVGFYPPTPPENIDAVLSAIEEFRTYWWDGRAKRSPTT
jgi:uroporphyrinogen-III decarboxylase